MGESINHKQLKTKARELLREKYGFLDSEIFEEFDYTLKNSVLIIIDVVGKNSGKFVAVECGNTPKLKQTCMKEEFGEENVILLPYDKIILAPLFYCDPKTRKEKTNLLKSIYNEYIYKKLKEDKDFQFIEYNQENAPYFYIGKKGEIWMAFPTKKNSIIGKDLQYEIGFTICYRGDNSYEITIGAQTNNSIRQFLELSETTKEKLIEELNRLPSGFEIQDGIKYKTEKVRMPPYLRNWEAIKPIPCNQISITELKEIEKRLRWYLEEGGKFEEYPILEIIRITIKKEELVKALLILKPIYESSFKFRTTKQEKVVHDELEVLKRRKAHMEMGLEEESIPGEFDRICKGIKELEENKLSWVV